MPTPRIAAPATPPPSAAAFGGGPSEPTGSQEPNRNPALVPVLIASCVVVAVITAGVVAVVLSGRGETAAPGTSVPVVSTAPAPPTTIPTTVPPPPPPPTIAPTTAPPPVQTSIVYRDVPAPVFSGRSIGPEEDSPWIAVVKSISKAEASFAEAEAQVRNFPEPDYPRGIGVVDTDEWDLTPGYWAIAVYSFDSRDEVEAHCRQWGLTSRDDCYPRNPFTGEK
ncbi:MAG: hypothetical protein ACOYOQ_13970 [Microthrixaceae bacterium]